MDGEGKVLLKKNKVCILYLDKQQAQTHSAGKRDMKELPFKQYCCKEKSSHASFCAACCQEGVSQRGGGRTKHDWVGLGPVGISDHILLTSPLVPRKDAPHSLSSYIISSCTGRRKKTNMTRGSLDKWSKLSSPWPETTWLECDLGPQRFNIQHFGNAPVTKRTKSSTSPVSSCTGAATSSFFSSACRN